MEGENYIGMYRPIGTYLYICIGATLVKKTISLRLGNFNNNVISTLSSVAATPFFLLSVDRPSLLGWNNFFGRRRRRRREHTRKHSHDICRHSIKLTLKIESPLLALAFYSSAEKRTFLAFASSRVLATCRQKIARKLFPRWFLNGDSLRGNLTTRHKRAIYAKMRQKIPEQRRDFRRKKKKIQENCINCHPNEATFFYNSLAKWQQRQ